MDKAPVALVQGSPSTQLPSLSPSFSAMARQGRQDEMTDLRRARANRASPTPTLTLIPVQEAPDVAVLAAETTHEPLPPEAPHEVVSGYPAELEAAACGQGLDWNCWEAMAVAWCEMGRRYQPWAINQTPIYNAGIENHATGAWQLALPLHAGLFDGDPLDVNASARAAYRLWSGSRTWNHWWCKP